MAEEPKFIMRLSKIRNNRLLDRLQMVVDVFYERAVKVTKESIKKKLLLNLKKIMLLFSVLERPTEVVEQDASPWYMTAKML